MSARRAAQNFKKFHGRSPDKVTFFNLTIPRAVTFLGRGVAIEYESDKPLHGKRKARLYRHKFSRNVRIYLHPNRRWLIIGGGKFRVTDWMRD